MIEAKEEWRAVVGYEGRYRVSSMGRVWDRRKAKLLHTGFTTKGYLRVNLADACGERRQYLVHVLIAEAFLGPKPAGHMVRHLDGVKHNNVLGNLAWGTASQNGLDVKWHGGGGSHKLLVWEVAVIKRALNAGQTIAALARAFEVAESTIRRIKQGEGHSDVQPYELIVD